MRINSSFDGTNNNDNSNPNPFSNEGPNEDSVNSEQTSSPLPWTSSQTWALSDLPYTPYSITLNTKTYILWRRLSTSTPELSGYPIPTLISKYTGPGDPTLLPYLTSYTLKSDNKIKGKVYNLPGLQDGTVIETERLDHLINTLPDYAVTEKGFLYELGEVKEEDTYVGGGILGDGVKIPKINLGGVNVNGDITNLAVLSGTVLAGAGAVNLLSHHLTVNMFWV